MRMRKCLAMLLLVLMVLTLLPGVSFAEPPVGPCPGRDSVRNDGNHFWNHTGHKDPTCLETGYDVYHCIYCNQDHTDVIPALGHDWGDYQVVTPPTCTEIGYQRITCRRDSSHTHLSKLQPLGHDWSEWYVVKEPTLTEEGLEERKCQRCGLTEQRPIPPLGQKEEYSLALVMSQSSPAGNTFAYDDLYGESGGILLVYNVTLINTGKGPLNVRDFVGGSGVSSTIDTAVLYPGESASFTLPWTLEPADIIPGSGSETLAGAAHYDFFFYGDDFDGYQVCVSNSASFDYKIQSPQGFEEWNILPDDELLVTKQVLSSPSDPNGYQLGELVDYKITVTNPGDMAVLNVSVVDDMFGYPEEKIGEINLNGHTTESFIFNHFVNADDVNRGFITNAAIARAMIPSVSWGDEILSGMASEVRSAPVTVTVINRAGLVVTKAVEGGPANGQYYVPGETVHFKVTVNNNTGLTQKAIMVVDPLVGEAKTCPDIEPGKSVTLDFDYVVTELDAIVGYVENYAYTMEIDGFSNTVRVDTGFDGPFGVITALEVTKQETSTPKDPMGYVLGETITYVITVTNVGETIIPEGTVCDSLKGGSGEIGSFENLYPSSSRTYNFSYVVTEKDIHSPSKKVVNQAAVWYDLDGHGAVQTSNLVESPVQGEGPYGFEDDDEGDDKSVLGGDDFCVRTLTGKGPGSEAFTTHFCSEHGKLLEELEEKKAAVTSEAQELVYVNEARLAWQTALVVMYEEAQSQVDSATADALMNQRLAWLEYIGSYEKLLNMLYPNAPLTVARELMTATRDRCVELCYELHKAPEKRPDSLLGTYEALHAAGSGDICEWTEAAPENGEIASVQVLCLDHEAVDEKVILLANEAANQDARTNAFLRAQRMWQTLMDNRTNAHYKPADKDTRAVIARNRVAFDKYLTARKAFLTALYPNEPDVVAEVIARTIMEKDMDLCRLWK